MRLKQAFRRLKPLAPNSNHSAVGQSVGFHENGGVFAEAAGPAPGRRRRSIVFSLIWRTVSKSAVRFQGVAAAEEQRDQVARYVPARDVEAAGEVVEDCGFVDGHNVRDAVAGVDYLRRC